MITWRATHLQPLCLFHTKPDFKMTGRKSSEQGDLVPVTDSEYADDTAVLFTSRLSLVASSPLLVAHFARFGMSVHVGANNQPSKSKVLFVAAPPHCYNDPATYDGADLTNIVFDDGTFMEVVAIFCYLGSLLSRDCRDDADVANRIEAAGGAFGALRSVYSPQLSYHLRRNERCTAF